jgi:molybdenum transport protein
MSSPAKFRPALPSAAIIPSAKPSSGSTTADWRVRTVASRAELEGLLADDVPYGDLTTDALGIGADQGLMQFTARDSMVLALAEDAAAIIELTGCRVELHASSGILLNRGAPILTAHGPASALLRSWKVAQTLIEIWSGVATDARAIVDAATAVAPNMAVACTRKNVPGTKRFAVAAVKAGGAVMHRLGLSESVLVFPEHRAFMGKEPLVGLVERLRRAAPEKKLVIEVATLEGAICAAAVGFDVIQAEKFSPAEIASLVARIATASEDPGLWSRRPAAFMLEMLLPTRRPEPMWW